MSRASVSVVIPAFRAAEFVRETLLSVGAQDHRPLQVIVVDDCSPDATGEVVEACRSELSAAGVELVRLRHAQNQGAAQALRTGFDAAQAPHVCWLSADDVFVEPWKVSRQLAFMNAFRCAVSFYRSYWSGPSRDRGTLVHPHWFRFGSAASDRYIEAVPERTLCALWRANPINGSSAMFERAAYVDAGGFDPAVRNVDPDGDMFMRLLVSGASIHGIDGAPLFYRVHANQTTQSDPRIVPGAEATRIRMIRGLLAGDRLGAVLREGGCGLLTQLAAPARTAYPSVVAELIDAMARAPWMHGPINRIRGVLQLRYREALTRARQEADALADAAVWTDFADRHGLVASGAAAQRRIA